MTYSYGSGRSLSGGSRRAEARRGAGPSSRPRGSPVPRLGRLGAAETDPLRTSPPPPTRARSVVGTRPSVVPRPGPSSGDGPSPGPRVRPRPVPRLGRLGAAETVALRSPPPPPRGRSVVGTRLSVSSRAPSTLGRVARRRRAEGRRGGRPLPGLRGTPVGRRGRSLSGRRRRPAKGRVRALPECRPAPRFLPAPRTLKKFF